MASHLKQDGDRSKIEVYPYLSPAQIFNQITRLHLHLGTPLRDVGLPWCPLYPR